MKKFLYLQTFTLLFSGAIFPHEKSENACVKTKSVTEDTVARIAADDPFIKVLGREENKIDQLARNYLLGKVSLKELEKQLSEKDFVLVAMRSAEKLAELDFDLSSYKPGSVLSLLNTASTKQDGIRAALKEKDLKPTIPGDPSYFTTVFLLSLVSALFATKFADPGELKNFNAAGASIIFSYIFAPLYLFFAPLFISYIKLFGFGFPKYGRSFAVAAKSGKTVLGAVEGNGIFERNARLLLKHASHDGPIFKKIFYVEREIDIDRTSGIFASTLLPVVYKPRGVNNLSKLSKGALKFIAERDLRLHNLLSRWALLLTLVIHPLAFYLVAKRIEKNPSSPSSQLALFTTGFLLCLLIPLMHFFATRSAVRGAFSKLRHKRKLDKRTLVDIERVEVSSRYRDFFPRSALLKKLASVSPLKYDIAELFSAKDKKPRAHSRREKNV